MQNLFYLLLILILKLYFSWHFDNKLLWQLCMYYITFLLKHRVNYFWIETKNVS